MTKDEKIKEVMELAQVMSCAHAAFSLLNLNMIDTPRLG